MTNYDRNRTRLDQLAALGMHQSSGGFAKDGYLVTNNNITYLTEEAWSIMISELKNKIGPKSDEETFEAYIKQLQSIKPPVMADTRLIEMVDIIDNLINDYTEFAKKELEVKP